TYWDAVWRFDCVDGGRRFSRAPDGIPVSRSVGNFLIGKFRFVGVDGDLVRINAQPEFRTAVRAIHEAGLNVYRQKKNRRRGIELVRLAHDRLRDRRRRWNYVWVGLWACCGGKNKMGLMRM